MKVPGVGRRTSAAVTMLLWLTLSSVARAGYDPWCDVAVDDYPPNGAEGVPRNPILVYPSVGTFDPYGGGPGELHLADASGLASSLILVEDIPGDAYGCTFVYQPRQPLSPQRQYTVRRDGATGPVLATFTTGDVEDLTPPEVAFEPPDGPWPDVIHYTGSEDIVLFTTTLSWGISTHFVAHTPAVVGRIEHSWLTDRLNDGRDVVLTAWDRAGNRTSVILPGYDEGCGCGASGRSGTEGGAAFLLLGVLLAWLRLRALTTSGTPR